MMAIGLWTRVLMSTRLSSSRNNFSVVSALSLAEKVTNTIKRMYSESFGRTPCWFCERATGKWMHMICDDCGYLCDMNPRINYFELLDIPKTFKLEMEGLTRNFRDRQSIVHLDKFSGRSLQEQTNSLEWNELLNKAYTTLCSSYERGQYLLETEGAEIPYDTKALDKTFLVNMMECEKELYMATTKKALQTLSEKINLKGEEVLDEITQNFQNRDFRNAALKLLELKNLFSLQEKIKDRLQVKSARVSNLKVYRKKRNIILSKNYDTKIF